MKRTTASGSSSEAWLVESLLQSTRPVLEIPVARCGSRVTWTPEPWSASLRAISMSSGVDSESPVTSRRWSGCGVLGAGGRDRAASGPRRGRESPAGELLVGGEPGGEVAAGVGERELVGDPARRAGDRLDDVAAEPGFELVRRFVHRSAGEEQQEDAGQPDRLDRVPAAEAPQAPAVEAAHQAVVAVRLALAAGAGLGLHLGDRLESLGSLRHQKRK